MPTAPLASRTPHTLFVAHIPARAAPRADLDHAPSLASAATQAPSAPCGGSDGAGRAGIGDDGPSRLRPCQHAALDVDGFVAVALQILGHPQGTTARVADDEQLACRGRSRPIRAGTSPIGMCWAPGAWPRRHSSSSRTSSRTAASPNSGGSRQRHCGTAELVHGPDPVTPAPRGANGQTGRGSNVGTIHSFHRFIHNRKWSRTASHGL